MSIETRYPDAHRYLGYLMGGRADGGQVAFRDLVPPDAMPDATLMHALGAVYVKGAAAHPINVFAYCVEQGHTAPPKADMLEWMSEAAGLTEGDFADLVRRIRRDYATERAAELIALGRLEAAQEVLSKYADLPEATTPCHRFTIRTEEDLAVLPPPEWLLPGELMRGGFHLIYGASGSGKTFHSIDRALRAAAEGARCLYIATEDLTGLKMRVAAWRYFHRDAPGRIIWLEMPQGLDLASVTQVDELVSTLTGIGLDLITLDTLREAHTGDENSSQDMAAVNRAVQRLIRETGAAVDLVHHTGVNEGRERGSTALGANCDLKWKVSSEDALITVSCEKFRHGPPFPSRCYRIVPVVGVESGAILLPASMTTSRGDAPLSPAQVKILEVLALSVFDGKGARTTQIAEAAALTNATLYRALSALKNRGYLNQGAKGDPYTLTPAGRAALGPDYQLSPDITHQGAQLSTLSINSHSLSRDYHNHSLSLSHPVGVRDESDGESWMQEAPPFTEEETAALAAAGEAISQAVQAFAANRCPATWEALPEVCSPYQYPEQALEGAGVPAPDDTEFAAWAITAAQAGNAPGARKYVRLISNGRRQKAAEAQVIKVLDSLAQQGATAADWPKVRACCDVGRYQAAYSAARGNAEAIEFIEAHKAAQLETQRAKAAD